MADQPKTDRADLDEHSSKNISAAVSNEQSSNLHDFHQPSLHRRLSEVATQQLRQTFFEARHRLIGRDDAVKRLKDDIMALRAREDELLLRLEHLWQRREQQIQQGPTLELWHDTEASEVKRKDRGPCGLGERESFRGSSHRIGMDEKHEPVERPLGPSPEEQERRERERAEDQKHRAQSHKSEQSAHRRSRSEHILSGSTVTSLKRPVLGHKESGEQSGRPKSSMAGSFNITANKGKTRETILEESDEIDPAVRPLSTVTGTDGPRSALSKRVSFSPEPMVMGSHRLSVVERDQEKARKKSAPSRAKQKSHARPTGLRKREGSIASAVSVVDFADKTVPDPPSQGFARFMRCRSGTPFDPRKTIR